MFCEETIPESQADRRTFEGLFAGLTPVLQAAAELPAEGLPIPSSAQERVRQYFAQQVGTVAAAEENSSATASPSRHGWVLPDTVKTISALQLHLRQRVDNLWYDQESSHAKPLMQAAAQLVADAACAVAEEQGLGRTSSALGVLLLEGYRAGIMATSCAGLRVMLGLHVVTHQQLARVVVVGRRAGGAMFNEALDTGDDAAGSSYAWTELRDLNGSNGSSSSSSPRKWLLSSVTPTSALMGFTTAAVNCFELSVVPSCFHTCHSKASPLVSLLTGLRKVKSCCYCKSCCCSSSSSSTEASAGPGKPARASTAASSSGSSSVRGGINGRASTSGNHQTPSSPDLTPAAAAAIASAALGLKVVGPSEPEAVAQDRPAQSAVPGAAAAVYSCYVAAARGVAAEKAAAGKASAPSAATREPSATLSATTSAAAARVAVAGSSTSTPAAMPGAAAAGTKSTPTAAFGPGAAAAKDPIPTPAAANSITTGTAPTSAGATITPVASPANDTATPAAAAAAAGRIPIAAAVESAATGPAAAAAHTPHKSAAASGLAAAAVVTCPTPMTTAMSSVEPTGVAGAGSNAPLPLPDLLTEDSLRERYFSSECFKYDVEDTPPLPQEALQLLVNLDPHTSTPTWGKGWTALHYACAMHRVDLVKQLLEAGASVSAAESHGGLQPLHLACMGRVRSVSQFHDMCNASASVETLSKYIIANGPGCLDLVEILLEKGADPNAWAGTGQNKFFAPLHITSYWTGGDTDDVFTGIYYNPFMGQAVNLFSQSQGWPASFALADSARRTQNSAARGLTRLDSLRPDPAASPARDSDRAKWELGYSAGLARDWSQDLELGVQHVKIVALLHAHGANINAHTEPHVGTPLMLAAGVGNAAVVNLLCRLGADTELWVDGNRALDIGHGFMRVGWTLMCHGAQAVPQWASRNEPCPNANLPSWQTMVCTAARSDEPWRCLFLQHLLADGAPVDVVGPTKETPLLLAIGRGDSQMVQLLVQAGADVDACATEGQWRGICPIARLCHAACNQRVPCDTIIKILKILIGLITYAPELLWCHPDNAKVPMTVTRADGRISTSRSRGTDVALIVTRFKAAENAGRKKREAAAATLEPWLHPGVLPAVKEATIRTLVAAGVTPHTPQQQQQQQCLMPVPAPLKPATWSGCLQQQLLQAAQEATSDDSGACQQQQQLVAADAAIDGPWPMLSAAAADSNAAAVKNAQQQQPQKRPAHSDDRDIAALLAALGEHATEAAPASSKVAASKKKKKKETAAQREAKKQEKLRLQRLQEQQQQQDRDGASSSGSAAKGAAGEDIKLDAAAANAGAAADARSRSHASAAVAGGAKECTSAAAAAAGTEADREKLASEAAAAAGVQDLEYSTWGDLFDENDLVNVHEAVCKLPSAADQSSSAVELWQDAVQPKQQQQLGEQGNVGNPAHKQQAKSTSSSTGGQIQPAEQSSFGVAAAMSWQQQQQQQSEGVKEEAGSRMAAVQAQALGPPSTKPAAAASLQQQHQHQQQSRDQVAALPPAAAVQSKAPEPATAAPAVAYTSTGHTSCQLNPAVRPFMPPHQQNQLSHQLDSITGPRLPVHQLGTVTYQLDPAARPFLLPQQQNATSQHLNPVARPFLPPHLRISAPAAAAPAAVLRAPRSVAAAAAASGNVAAAGSSIVATAARSSRMAAAAAAAAGSIHVAATAAAGSSHVAATAAVSSIAAAAAVSRRMVAAAGPSILKAAHPAAATAAAAAATVGREGRRGRTAVSSRSDRTPVPEPFEQDRQQQQADQLEQSKQRGTGSITAAGSGFAAAAEAALAVASLSDTARVPDAGLLHVSRSAGSSKPPGGVKGPKLCVSCGIQRSNVLLLPCKHMVLCDACADMDSCPSCGQMCKQRVKVHQS